VKAGFLQVAAGAEYESGSATSGFTMERSQRAMGKSTVSWFGTIPPERVGLNGEYDHRGLAKRVSLVFRQQCSSIEIEQLRVSQRGAVVVLMGKIPERKLLVKLVNLAMSVPGTADVEVNGVSVGHELKPYSETKPSREALLNLQELVTS
jgi:hypothetical protein